MKEGSHSKLKERKSSWICIMYVILYSILQSDYVENVVLYC